MLCCGPFYAEVVCSGYRSLTQYDKSEWRKYIKLLEHKKFSLVLFLIEREYKINPNSGMSNIL